MLSKKLKKRGNFIRLSLPVALFFMFFHFLNTSCQAEDSISLFHKKLKSQDEVQRLGYMIIEPLNKDSPYGYRGTQISSSKYNKYKDIILEIAQKYSVDPVLIHSIISVESDYDSFSVSSKGAVGLMQLMPETAREYGVKNLYDPRENIEGGVKFLIDLKERYKGREDLILAAYNAGPETVKKYKGVPPYSETINFIRKVKNARYGRIKGTSTRIYRFYDSSGRLVLTNNPRLQTINMKKNRE